MAQVLRQRHDVRVYWHAQHVVDARELDRRPWGWRWEQGRIFDAYFVERSYLHFMTWKNTMRHIDFGYGDAPDTFIITPRGIRHRPPNSYLGMVLERIPPAAVLYRRLYNAVRYILTGRGRL